MKKKSQISQIVEIRKYIDKIDENLIELLEERFLLSKQMGILKKKEKIPIFQKARYMEILFSRLEIAKKRKMNVHFIKKFFILLHHESVKIQKKINTK